MPHNRSPLMPLTAAALTVAVLLGFAAPATALINPDFTPIDMVRRSQAIIALEVGKWSQGDQRLTVLSTEAVQGEAPRELVIETTNLDMRSAATLEREAAGERNPALVFTGDFSAAALQEAMGTDQPVAVIHINLTWFGLYPAEEGRLRLGPDPLDLSTVWAGGHGMLRGVVDYIRSDPRAEVPVVVAAEWVADEAFGHFDATVRGMMAVELRGGDKPWLLVLTDEGDRLLERTGAGRWQDHTAEVGLGSRSRHAAVGDFDGNGRLDIASWTGDALELHLQGEDGRFSRRAVALDGELDGITGLTVWAPAGAKRSGLVLSPATGGPIVLAPEGGDGFTQVQLEPLNEQIAAGPVAVGDFTGDGINDIAQPLADGLALYRGKADGGFAAAQRAAEAALGEELNSTAVGDFDGSGRLDVLANGRRGTAMLINKGDGLFEEMMEESGEPSYIARPGAVGVRTLDVNSDGRHDFLLLYDNMGMHVYFNRGFRTFGYSISLELGDAMLDGTDAAMDGQVAATVADFTGNGHKDLALVTVDGEGWLLSTGLTEGEPRGVTVALDERIKGPVRISAVEGRRSLGSRIVRPGKPVYLGKTARGPLEIAWHIPGQPEQSRRIIALERQRFVIPAP